MGPFARESLHLSQLVFLIIATLGLIAALGTVLSRNLIHAAMFLVAFFFVVACQFVLLDAEFLAVVQVLIYIGAVAILLVFGVMLTQTVTGDTTTTIPKGWIIPALVASLGIFFVLTFGIKNHVGLKSRSAWSVMRTRPALVETSKPDATLPARQAAVNSMGKTVGDEMLTRYAVGFEAAGVLLTAALVGAVAISYRAISDDEKEEPSPTATTEVAAETEVRSLA